MTVLLHETPDFDVIIHGTGPFHYLITKFHLSYFKVINNLIVNMNSAFCNTLYMEACSLSDLAEIIVSHR
jgi:hypothetical protein